MRRLLGRLALLLLTCLAPAGLRAGEVTVSPAGEPRAVYRWAADRCEDEFIPDAPARAFRRADGRMVLLATHRENWSLVGADFASLKSECRSLLRSSELRPQRLGELWIEAVWTRDGRDVAALVSQDLSSLVRAGGCAVDDRPGRCWLNNLLAARSGDGGRSFALVPPARRMVATLGDRYPERAAARYGVFTTSNIVRRDDGYYMIASLHGAGAQEAGNCLFRTRDPFDPQGWRGWDGQGFTVDLGRPAGEGAGLRCAVLPAASLPTEVRSLGYDARHGVWIAAFLGRARLPGDAQPVPGFYYATSPDLLGWSAPRRIAAAPTQPRQDSQEAIVLYPSILDPGSASRNFETIDTGRPVLLYTLRRLRSALGSMDRDLMALPLRID